MKEAQAATHLPCLTGGELQSGALNDRLHGSASKRSESLFATARSREEFLKT
jgi:hypothetical protein